MLKACRRFSNFSVLLFFISSALYVSAQTVVRQGTQGTSWTAGMACNVGTTFVLAVPDNLHVFVATTNGSAGGTQPTWNISAGALTTDGSCTWQEAGESGLGGGGGGGGGGVTSFNGRSGAVLPGLSDYTVAQISGAAPLLNPIFSGTLIAPIFANSGLTNDATVGTFLNEPACLTSAGNAVACPPSATGGIIGLVTAGAGTTGSPTIASGGVAPCVFDTNPVAAGHYVVVSALVGGNSSPLCADGGNTPRVEPIGLVQALVSGTTWNVVIGPESAPAAAPDQVITDSNASQKIVPTTATAVPLQLQCNSGSTVNCFEVYTAAGVLGGKMDQNGVWTFGTGPPGSATTNIVNLSETTAPTCAVNQDVLYGDSTAHRSKECDNNGAFVQLVHAGGDINNSDQVISWNGGSIPASASVLGSNASSQPLAATAHAIGLVLSCADASGSGTAQTCTTTPSFTPAAKDCINYTPGTTNTAALTLNVNSSSAAPVKKWLGTALASGDAVAGETVPACFDGTNWNLTTIGNAPSGGGGVNAGTAGQVTYYASTGSTVSGNANLTISAGALTVGVGGTQQGSLKIAGATSGTTTLAVPATASGTQSLQAVTDTLVDRATTDTLTNKTLVTASSGNSVTKLGFAGDSGAITGNAAFQNLVSVTISGNVLPVNACMVAHVVWAHTGSASVQYRWSFGTAQTTAWSSTSGGTAALSDDVRICNNGATNAQDVEDGPAFAGTGAASGSHNFATSAIDTTVNQTLAFQFSVANTDSATPKTFFDQLIQ